jgi:hypothetical protein
MGVSPGIRSLASFLCLYSPGLVGSGLQPCERRAVRASALVLGNGFGSMNPLLTEVSTMTITSTLHSLRAHPSTNRHPVPVHPEPLPLVVPGEINDPATAAGAALALCRSRWDEVTLALYLDNQHRLVGHAVVATGWVQAALLSARPILAGADACQASTCILIRYRRYGTRSASEAENRSFRTIAAACSRYGLAVSDHLVVVATGEYSSSLSSR